MNWPATPAGGGNGMKCRKPFSPITKKIKPARYRAITEAVFITRFSFFDRRRYIDVVYIDVNILDDVYFPEIQVFMTQRFQGTDHAWLVMMKAMRALTRYATAGVQELGLGLSDLAVLELLLHKG